MTTSVGAGHAAAGASAEEPGRTQQRLELQRVAQQFEAMLLSQMLREMRKTVEWNEGDEGSQGLGLGTESFTEAIDGELALHLARSGGIGLTSQLMQSFDRLPSMARPGSDVGAVPRWPAVPTEPAAGSPSSAVAIEEARVTSGFGWRSDPFSGASTFHKGVDLRAAYGQDVQAPAEGTVVFSGEQGGYGMTVVLEHADGSRSRYAHLSAATVDAGARVGEGQAVGRVGRSGRATGTHLHFEVTGADGRPVPPGEWLKALQNVWPKGDKRVPQRADAVQG